LSRKIAFVAIYFPLLLRRFCIYIYIYVGTTRISLNENLRTGTRKHVRLRETRVTFISLVKCPAAVVKCTQMSAQILANSCRRIDSFRKIKPHNRVVYRLSDVSPEYALLEQQYANIVRPVAFTSQRKLSCVYTNSLPPTGAVNIRRSRSRLGPVRFERVHACTYYKRNIVRVHCALSIGRRQRVISIGRSVQRDVSHL